MQGESWTAAAEGEMEEEERKNREERAVFSPENASPQREEVGSYVTLQCQYDHNANGDLCARECFAYDAVSKSRPQTVSMPIRECNLKEEKESGTFVMNEY